MTNKILWVRPDAIGDAIVSLSMLPYIKRHYANAHITVLCQEHVAELYYACPLIDAVLIFDKKEFVTNNQYQSILLSKFTNERYDLAINTVYSRELSMDPLVTSIGAGRSIGFRVTRRRARFDFPFRYNHSYTTLVSSPGVQKSELERYRDFLDELGIECDVLYPQIWIRLADDIFADNFFIQHQLEPETTIAFFGGAQSAHRLYMHYGDALRTAFAGHDITVIAFGGASDAVINVKNLTGIPSRVIDISGSTTLLQTAAILKRCRLAFGAETGLAHMACAVGIPNVVLLGGGHFGRFMPYSPLTSTVILPLACYGCDWRCRYKKTYCVQDVDPEVLACALKETLRTTSSKPRLFVQSNSRYQRGLYKPRWQLPQKYLDARTVDVIVVD